MSLLSGCSERLARLKAELDEARERILASTTVAQYDHAVLRAAYLRGLIERYEPKRAGE
jgi:hypothetical protein